jgi:hypothetical protein
MARIVNASPKKPQRAKWVARAQTNDLEAQAFL